MAKAVIAYDKDLPEIPGRRPLEKPTSYMAKDEAIRDWCERISEATGTKWRYVRVDQPDFMARKPTTVADLAY